MIRIGIVGTGGMANAHAKAYKEMRGCKVVAGCDVVEERVRAFCERHDVPAAYTDFDEMLGAQQLDAVSNVTPDAFHCPVSLEAIRAGLHVLCEKPLAVDYREAKKMADAARRKGVVNMVNLSYRNSSAIHRAHELIAEGGIGRVMHLEASYLQSGLSNRDWSDPAIEGPWLWRLSTGHGSRGVLGDLGVHILDFATYAAGDIRSVDCRLKTFPKVKGDRIGEYRLDANDSAAMTVELKDGAIGVIHTSRWATGHGNSIRLGVYGERGAVEIDLDKSYGELRLCQPDKQGKMQWLTVKCQPTPNIYRRFIKSIQTGQNDQPDFARGAAIQKVLDACFASSEQGCAVKV